MPNTTELRVTWAPQTPDDRELVLTELTAILASHHFKNSKRYPALLRYVVHKALGGQSAELKERTLGVEVFDRPANYDTNTDPVVRFTASEVRKRIAQFYHERGRESGLEINLPLGSYIPEFTIRQPSTKRMDETDPSAKPEHQEVVARSAGDAKVPAGSGTVDSVSTWVLPALQWRFFLPAVLFAGLAPFGAYALHLKAVSTVADTMWRPLLRPQGPVQIVINTGNYDPQSPPDPAHEILASQLHGAYRRITVCDAVAVSRLTSMLGNQSKAYEVKEADFTSLSDLRNRSVILIGAYNNLWTMRLMEPLRFHFVKEGHGVQIVDAQRPSETSLAVDYSRSSPSAVYDYAIVARYTDPTTNGSVLIIAGIGAYGTEAASEAVTTPSDLKKLMAAVPKGWENRNIELVIRTAVINGESGPSDLVSFATW